MHVSVVVIGAGHAGLAMSQRLRERGVEHAVLDRADVAASWRAGRWDSLRLLTPNWHTRLPGMVAPSEDPDGFMTAGAVATMLAGYARTIEAPVVGGVTVRSLRSCGDGFEVITDEGRWACDAAVVATGGAARATVPPFAATLPRTVASVPASDYRSPGRLAEGGVLVVGASATGVQLAEEIQASGRPVTLAVGEHVRMPRTYRGRDVFWWTEAAGILGERAEQIDDLVRARRLPSPQLVGSSTPRSIGLDTLQDAGVRLVGRLGRIKEGIAQFSGGLANMLTLADLKLGRLLRSLDETARERGWDDETGPPETFAPVRLAAPPLHEIDLGAAGIRTVVWATGYRPDHRFVELPVFDHAGRLRHDGGVVAPGLYVLGLNVLRRRRSSYIAGAAADTAELADELVTHLARR